MVLPECLGLEWSWNCKIAGTGAAIEVLRPLYTVVKSHIWVHVCIHMYTNINARSGDIMAHEVCTRVYKPCITTLRLSTVFEGHLEATYKYVYEYV